MIRLIVVVALIVAVVAVAHDNRNDVRLGYVKYLVGSHIVFFRTTSDGIEVVRILHASMDFKRHV